MIEAQLRKTLAIMKAWGAITFLIYRNIRTILLMSTDEHTTRAIQTQLTSTLAIAGTVIGAASVVGRRVAAYAVPFALAAPALPVVHACVAGASQQAARVATATVFAMTAFAVRALVAGM